MAPLCRSATWLLAAGALLAGCARPAAPAPPSKSHPARSASAPSSTTTTTTSSIAPTTGAVAAWVLSEREFYEAGRLGEPDYPPLLSTFAAGSPALKEVVSFLSVLATAGVSAPSSYRIGNGRLLSEKDSRAVVSGCADDSGSIYRATGAPAPPGLGGGAGLTAYEVTLEQSGGRWLVWSVSSSSATSSSEPGPCHGF